MMKCLRKKKRSFLLLEILLAMGLCVAILPFIFKQFSTQKIFLENKLIELQIEKIKEETLFNIEQEIKEILATDPGKLNDLHVPLTLCSQKIMSSKQRWRDVFYEYTVTQVQEYNKRERRQNGSLITIIVQLGVPQKKQMTIERRMFFSYEAM